MTYLVAAQFPVWSNFCGFIYYEDEFSTLYQRKSVYGKEFKNNKGEDFSFGNELYCAQTRVSGWLSSKLLCKMIRIILSI